MSKDRIMIQGVEFVRDPAPVRTDWKARVAELEGELEASALMFTQVHDEKERLVLQLSTERARLEGVREELDHVMQAMSLASLARRLNRLKATLDTPQPTRPKSTSATMAGAPYEPARPDGEEKK